MKLEREGYKLVHFESWGGAPHKLASNALHLNGEAIVELVGGRLCVHLKEESAPAWNGEGLPPAGTVCELRNVAAGTAWAEATIVFASRNVIVWDWVGEPPINGLCTAYAHAVEMRPIRTPEQIAAEERERAIFDMARILAGGGEPDKMDIGDAGLVYDAGYRKQVQP